MIKLKVLVACEESQVVTIELRKLGHEAYSCDMQPESGGHPEWHLQQDVIQILKHKWDLIIAFPPCTYLSTVGNRWFNVERYGQKAIQRYKDREFGIKFFKTLYNSNCDHVAIENPVGIMSTELRKPDQIINPYQFGDPYEKKTCLWLKGLPKLQHTKIVLPPPRTIFKSGKSLPTWYSNLSYHPERSKLRSKTFPGIANGMANQWSSYVLSCSGIPNSSTHYPKI